MRAIRVRTFMFWKVILFLSVAGCNGDGGSTVRCDPQEPDVQSLWIDGYYRHFSTVNPWSPVSGGLVFVREEDDGGNPASDVTVRLGGTTLSYDESAGAYTCPAIDADPGEELTLVVCNSEDSVASTVIVPFPPKNLYLRSDTWNISGPEIGNTLRWTPPGTLGERLVVYLYTSTRGEDYLIWYAVRTTRSRTTSRSTTTNSRTTPL